MKSLIYPIIEYQSFGVSEISKFWKSHDKLLQFEGMSQEEKEEREKVIQERAEKFYKSLENFLEKHKDNKKFLKYPSRNKLKARNYVGIIQTPYGTLEILPKCFRETNLAYKKQEHTKESIIQNKQEQKIKIKNFFKLDSFKKQLENDEIQSFALFDTPQKSAQRFLIHCLSFFKQKLIKKSQISSIDTCNTPLLDVFMQMFCQELLEVCKKGIRHDYVTIEENRPYLKGKLLFSGQIRHNLVHKERFYTSSDEYIADIAPNRLIKSTLELINSKATSHATLTLINQCLEIFEEIPSSGNIEGDFLSCTSSRHFSYYDNLLEWCKLFLQGNSFSAYSGESKAYALLFPMEKLFESYVAHMLKQNNPNTTIHAQSSSQHLLYTKNNSPLFQLKPDLLFEIKEGEKKRKIIADTKWKPLKNAEDKKHGIAQSDLYQVFAYAHYHQAQEVWLIYPKLYEQNDSEKGEIKKIIENLKEWNTQEHHYCHPCTFEEVLKHHRIKLKIFFAPLAFH